MKPIVTGTTNAIFKRDGYSDLPGTACHDSAGNNYIETAWSMSPEELAQISRTGIVYVAVAGTEIPPISVSADTFMMDDPSGEMTP